MYRLALALLAVTACADAGDAPTDETSVEGDVTGTDLSVRTGDTTVWPIRSGHRGRIISGIAGRRISGVRASASRIGTSSSSVR